MMNCRGMMIAGVCLCAVSWATRGVAADADNLADLVVPLQGTDSTRDFSHGNTYPTVALPFPMNAWSPYTQPAKDPFYYQYRAERIYGIGKPTSRARGSEIMARLR
jgi:putative alpha-1,2-mannosidase